MTYLLLRTTAWAAIGLTVPSDDPVAQTTRDWHYGLLVIGTPTLLLAFALWLMPAPLVPENRVGRA